MPIIRSSRRKRWLPHRPSGSRVAAGWRLGAGRMDEFPDRRLLHPSLRKPIHPACLPAATREPDGLCGNQRYRQELLTMGIMVPETCRA